MGCLRCCRNVKVAGIEKFGLFVEFLPGKSGLVHVSELLADEDLNDFDLHDEIDVILLAVSHPCHAPNLNLCSSLQCSQARISLGLCTVNIV